MRDGTKYTNAEISSVTAAYAIVFYGEGSGVKIAMTNLPDLLQKQYQFDPEKAVAELEANAQKLQTLKDSQAKAQHDQKEFMTDRLYRFVNGKLVPISQLGVRQNSSI